MAGRQAGLVVVVVPRAHQTSFPPCHDSRLLYMPRPPTSPVIYNHVSKSCLRVRPSGCSQETNLALQVALMIMFGLVIRSTSHSHNQGCPPIYLMTESSSVNLQQFFFFQSIHLMQDHVAEEPSSVNQSWQCT